MIQVAKIQFFTLGMAVKILRYLGFFCCSDSSSQLTYYRALIPQWYFKDKIKM